MAKIVTNNGFIVDSEKLKDYFSSLAILTKKLDQSKNDAILALVEMQSENQDETFSIFVEHYFKKNIQYIEELKDLINYNNNWYNEHEHFKQYLV